MGLDTIRWHENKLTIIDQTLLPAELKYIVLDTAESVWEAIRALRVRGAPAIGVTAAYGVVIGLQTIDPRNEPRLLIGALADTCGGFVPCSANSPYGKCSNRRQNTLDGARQSKR